MELYETQGSMNMREVPGWDCWGDHFGGRYE